MKAPFLLMTAILSLLFVAPLHAEWHHNFGAGYGGDSDTNSFSIEVGKNNLSRWEQTWMISGGLTFIYHGDGNVPDEAVEGPAPHDDITRLGDKDDGTEIGLYGKVGRKVHPKNIYATLLLGGSYGESVDLVQSNLTGTYYAQATNDEFYPIYGLGVAWFPEFFAWELKMNFQLDYDNRRGVSAYVGWVW